jgi:hypothetical protein
MDVGTRVQNVIQVITIRIKIGTRVQSFFHNHKTDTLFNDARRHTLEHGGSIIG